MKKYILILFLSVLGLAPVLAQRTLLADSTIVSQHEVTVKGQRFSYTATSGTQPVWNADGEVEAALHFTYYERNDVDDRARRPLVISFNGGPGSASVWMHIAYTGPRLLNIDDEGYPVQPYGFKENPYSILDVADIVYVNPVNTGYSRLLSPDADRADYFGVNADIKYLAEWLNTFVSRQNRWESPKFLIGESYGTTRVSGLALELQESQWMYLNGVVLVSPTELGLNREGPVAQALRLPYYAATAWYHKALPSDLQQKDLVEILPDIEQWTIDTYVPAMVRAGSLSAQEKESIATQVARFSGIDKKVILQNNLDVETSLFWKELLRDKGYTVGRLDSRYLGMDRSNGGIRPDFNSELTTWLHAFTPAINHYMKSELGYVTDVKYNMFGPVRPWDNSNDNTGKDLGKAMSQNPYLHLLVQSGYYDGACDYFNAKYNMWHIDPSGRLQERMDWKGYRSGHMMYLRKQDLEQANEDLREFIAASLPGEGVPAMYPHP